MVLSDNNMSSLCQQAGPAWQREKSPAQARQRSIHPRHPGLQVLSLLQVQRNPWPMWYPQTGVTPYFSTDHSPLPAAPECGLADSWRPHCMPASEALDQHLWLLHSPQGEGIGLASITMRTALRQLADVAAGAGVWGLTSQTSVKRWREHSGNCARF